MPPCNSVPLPKIDPMLPVPFRIVKRARETKDTFRLELVPASGETPPAFAPGQFNMLYVFGAGEVAISISGDPARRDLLHHTVRAVGSVTKAMQALKPGGTIGVRGPFGTGWPLAEAEGKDVVIIAGGIGLAPLRGAVHYLLANRSRYRQVSLLYGARTPSDVLYRKELARLAAHPGLHFAMTVDRAARDWPGQVGAVTSLLGRAPFSPRETVAMMCGPEIMMRFATRDLLHRGVPAEAVYVSLERNMKCAVGFCGHCQFGPEFICKDGPVFRHDRVARWLGIHEL